MARSYRRRRKRDTPLEDALAAFLLLFILAVGAYAYTHREQIVLWGAVILVIMLAGIAAYYFLNKSKKGALLNLSDDQIIYMLKGMTPQKFEQEIAVMFVALGYKAEVVGGANDGGIDIKAYKDGKKYYIQCKKFITREATPHDVRDFLGAITNINDPAEKGFFITTNKFTLAAEKTAEGNPRIELIDGPKLAGYYRMAYENKIPELAQPDAVPHPQPSTVQQTKRSCPKCGGALVLRTARHGTNAGGQFWGCSNYPKCHFIENVH